MEPSLSEAFHLSGMMLVCISVLIVVFLAIYQLATSNFTSVEFFTWNSLLIITGGIGFLMLFIFFADLSPGISSVSAVGCFLVSGSFIIMGCYMICKWGVLSLIMKPARRTRGQANEQDDDREDKY